MRGAIQIVYQAIILHEKFYKPLMCYFSIICDSKLNNIIHTHKNANNFSTMKCENLFISALISFIIFRVLALNILYKCTQIMYVYSVKTGIYCPYYFISCFSFSYFLIAEKYIKHKTYHLNHFKCAVQ